LAGDGSERFISEGEGKRRYCNRVVRVRIGVHVHHRSGKTGKKGGNNERESTTSSMLSKRKQGIWGQGVF
jgi:hypothetical protein